MSTFRQRIAEWIAPELRAIYTQKDVGLVEALAGEQTASGQRPTPNNVEGLATATSCVNVTASSLLNFTTMKWTFGAFTVHFL